MTDTAEEAILDTTDELLAKLKAVRISHSMKKAAFLRFSQGAMHGEVFVWVVGTDGDRYKIQTDTRICIDGRSTYLDPGQTLYIPKSSVWLARDYESQST